MKMKCTHGKEESVRERGRGGREDQEMLLSQDFDWVQSTIVHSTVELGIGSSWVCPARTILLSMAFAFSLHCFYSGH